MSDRQNQCVQPLHRWLTEVPEIRSRRLAFNRGATFEDAFVAATPLLAQEGSRYGLSLH